MGHPPMSKDLDALNEQIEKDIELDRRKKALSIKELDLKEKRVDHQFNELVKNNEETEKSENVKFGQMSNEAIEQVISDNEDYLEAAKHPIPFICDEFDSLVPFFRKNLVMVTSPSGKGKSTACANIIYTAMQKKNPITGKPYKIMVLTNEEAPEDVFNRLSCFIRGWTYTDHDKFTDEQRAEFSKFIRIFTQKGNVTVIGDVYEGVSGWTTSVEGIVKIFDNLIRDGNCPDVVILDYYQNVTRSREQPELNEYQVQRLLANEFDRIKNIFPGVITIMAQIDAPKDDEDTTPYNFRFKGTKLIITKCTFICEIVAEYALLRSTWLVHKSRFTSAMGKKIITGFDRGRYVPYTPDFQRNVAKLVEKNLERAKEQELGIQEKKEGSSDE
jgi:hypothetical protein